MTAATSQFTSKERDTETGLDYFGARYHSPSQGRFMIPDPSSGGITPLDPQSWNKYSYVRNRPTRFMDIDWRKLGHPLFLLATAGKSDRTLRSCTWGSPAEKAQKMPINQSGGPISHLNTHFGAVV